MNDISHILDKKSRLKTKLDLVPEKPGVYLHKNNKNEIVYVGKAKNLKNRLKSYFGTQSGQNYKTQTLIEHIEDFDFIITKNEYESIIAENNLIKHHQPRYNILLKDSKTYPYLKIDLKDKWPQLTFTRRKKSDDALYFGPYPNTGFLDKILNIIHTVFPLVRCSKHTFKTISRPCNYYHIQQCLAPCHLSVDHNEYLQIVDNVIAVLRGKTKKIIENIKTEIKTASAALNFEKAAKFRDAMKALESISDQQSVDIHAPLNIDFVTFLSAKDYFIFYVAYVRSGVFIGADSFVDIIPKHMNCSEDLLPSLLLQFYDKHESPETVFFTDEQNPKELFKKYKLKKENQKQIELLIDLSSQNAKFKLEEKIKIDAASADKMIEVQKLLNLPKLPQWIEYYDISTFQGTATVGARIVFKNGLPSKSLYRKYIIRDHIGKMDDFAGLKEVLRRRFKDRKDADEIDLLVLDGGTPQVHEVAYLFKALGLEKIFLVGLAKQRTESHFTSMVLKTSQERLVIPARNANHELLPDSPPHIIELDPHSKAFRLLVSLRDETHRFAITFHRKRRDSISGKSGT